MRIACIHVPQFALQTLTRLDPSLRGAAVAVVGSGLDIPGVGSAAQSPRRAALTSPVVQACSRGAWALGVRIGMTAMAANTLAPGQLRVVTADLALERETVRAIADAVLGASAVVDVGGRIGPAGAHLAMYCEVPSKTRGTSFGDKLVELLDVLGLTARIGIADDRFTAWVAAAHGTPARRAEDRPGSATSHPLDDSGVVSVPRGGSAAFLAPRPLSLLAITPEVQHMLEALGVRTLGEFAALPAPSVARPIEADYQALARGDSGHTLRPYAPEAPIREDIVVSTVEGGLGTGAAIQHLADRIALRLAGRGRGAARLEVTLSSASGDEAVAILPGVTSREHRPVPVSALLEAPAAYAGAGTGTRRVIESPEELANAIGLALDADQASPWRIRATVTGEAIAVDATSAVAAHADAARADAASAVAAPAMAASAAAGRAVAASAAAARGAASAAAARGAATRAVGDGSDAGLAIDLALAAARSDAGVAAARSDIADYAGPSVDLLGVVLSSTGHGPHAPVRHLRDERRDAHRRTRRGKEAARRRERDRDFVQARLFADRK